METNGATSKSAFRRVRGLSAELETGVKTHPFVTAAAIAGVSFVGGMLLGSRVARGVVVAVAPAIVYRLLEGPLGERLDRYVRIALGGTGAPPRAEPSAG